MLPDHRATEKMLKESGIEHNIMRNNLYMENYLTTSVMLAMLSGNSQVLQKTTVQDVARLCFLEKANPIEHMT